MNEKQPTPQDIAEQLNHKMIMVAQRQIHVEKAVRTLEYAEGELEDAKKEHADLVRALFDMAVKKQGEGDKQP